MSTRFGLLSGINVTGLFVPISKRLWFFKSIPRFSEIDILKSLNLMAALRLNGRSRVTTSNKLCPIVYRKDSTVFTQRFANLTSLGCGSGLLTSLPYLWMPLVEFVGIGEAGLDLCQCVSIGAELHTKPNAHTCATHLYTCTC